MCSRKEMDDFIQQKLNELSNINSVQYTPEFREFFGRLLIAGFKGFWSGFNPEKMTPERFEGILHAIPKSAYRVAREYFDQIQERIYESPADN